MFIPIFPNTDPDSERPTVHPIRPTPAPFPRGDCSHWTDSEVWVAFRRVPEGLDNASAYRLPCKAMSLIRETYSNDHARIRSARAKEAIRRSSHPPLDDGPSSQVLEPRPPQDREEAVGANAPPTERVDASPDRIPDASGSEASPFNRTFIPIAKLSLDIGWISEADSLPDVYDFL
ncbi:hypothetical protein LXA43DRAFT_510450 [Ganoderma leucocontextum]|nr:hypothetical protein LXA43DRAFT_510450 [Ganoderma leucocontextum]